MNNGITYCIETPLRASVSDWLNHYVGRISVGKRTDQKKEIAILAYSDDESDSAELRKFADDQGALYIRSISGGGVTAID